MSDFTVPSGAGAAGAADRGGISGLQLRTIILCGLAGILDGNDTGIMSIAVPAFASTLGLPTSALGWAISGSFLGAAVGAAVCGSLADRFGRKTALIASVLMFGLFTILTPFATTLPQLVLFRVLAGIGLGGATPCFVTLSAEYAPTRIRATVVSLVWASFPLGLLIGGLGSSLLLTYFTWQTLFYIGGAVPLAVAALMVGLLPESIAFLLSRERTRPQAMRILDRVGPDLAAEVRANDAWPKSAAGSSGGFKTGGFKMLLSGGLRGPTLCLWLILFACFGTTAAMTWVPAILNKSGVPVATAAIASSALGIGALIGMAGAGRLVDRFGAARALIPPVLLGAVATAAIGWWPASPFVASAFVALVGALVGLGASGAIALVALTYPAEVRSTGAGWALGMGRVGQVVAPGIFAMLMGLQWSFQAIFLMLALCPLVAAATVAVFSRLTAGRTTGERTAVPLH